MVDLLPYIPTMIIQRRRWRLAYAKHLQECLTRVFRAWQLWTSLMVIAYKPMCSSTSGLGSYSRRNILCGALHGWKRVTRELHLPGALLKQKRAAVIADFLTRHMVKVSYVKCVTTIEEPIPDATLSKRGWEKAVMLFRRSIHYHWNRRPPSLQTVSSDTKWRTRNTILLQ